jgi:hypothetical protein
MPNTVTGPQGKSTRQPITAAEAAGPSIQRTKPATSKPLPLSSDKTVFGGDGIFVVGIDIVPGVYRTPGPADDVGYFALLSSTSTRDIIESDEAAGPVTITVEPGVKAVQVHGFRPWRRVADDLDSAIDLATQ